MAKKLTLKSYLEFEVKASIECGNCGEKAELENECTLDEVSSVAADVADELIEELQDFGWIVSDLNGQLDGLYPVCKECQEHYLE